MIDRRKFLTSTGTTITAISLSALLPEAHAIEINPKKKYLVVFNQWNISAEKLLEIEEWLRASGLNCIVMNGDPQLYQIELEEKK